MATAAIASGSMADREFDSRRIAQLKQAVTITKKSTTETQFE